MEKTAKQRSKPAVEDIEPIKLGSLRWPGHADLMRADEISKKPQDGSLFNSRARASCQEVGLGSDGKTWTDQ